ncbi:MAG: hypothetical protein SWH68_15920 [Thermodesulfobacteriota bacterium]|nr:hypothetical protein [Thermodesulfobacteriota bacterium]
MKTAFHVRHTFFYSFVFIFLTTAVFSAVAPSPATAESGKIIVQLLGHYTDDEEWFDEEWTFEVNARFVRDGGELGIWRPLPFRQNIWNGDSDPDNNDWHNLPDVTIFERTFFQLPEKIEIKQRGWENDCKARRIYNCCKWWRNDDDNYGTGSKFVNVADLPPNEWKTYDWPKVHGPHGLKARVKLEQTIPPEIRSITPDQGCKGDQDLAVNIAGANFIQGMTVNISGAGVTVNDVNVASSSLITAELDIAAAALSTRRNVRVYKPDQPVLTDTLTNGFEVLAATDPACIQSFKIQPDTGCQGIQNQDVTLYGEDFVEGTNVRISGLGITVHDIIVESANIIRMKVDIGNLAPVTARTVRVFPPGRATPSAVLEDGYHVLDKDEAPCRIN